MLNIIQGFAHTMLLKDVLVTPCIGMTPAEINRKLLNIMLATNTTTIIITIITALAHTTHIKNA
jgi:hypothetical protein